jgi:hypothetical protein
MEIFISLWIVSYLFMRFVGSFVMYHLCGCLFVFFGSGESGGYLREILMGGDVF